MGRKMVLTVIVMLQSHFTNGTGVNGVNGSKAAAEGEIEPDNSSSALASVRHALSV